MKRKDQPGFNLAVIEMSKRARFDPLRNFGPEQLVRAIEAFRVGRLRELTLAIDAMEERDDVLSCVVPKAKSAVARHGYDILTVETESAGDAKLAADQQRVLRDFYNQLRVTNALDQDELGGVSLLLRQLMDAKSKRYAIHNVVLQPGRQLTAKLWFTPQWFFENATGRMRFIEQPGGYDGTDMAPDEWLVTKGLGIGIACAVARTYKSLALRDWIIYSARCGLPGVEGITDAAPGTAQWENMVRAVEKAAAEFRWVRNRSEEIKTIDFGKNSGELPYPPLVERMDRAMAALWRGADLGTISKDGQAVGSNPQESETDLIEQDDAQWLSETLQLKLDRIVLDYVFGADAPALAYFQVSRGEQQNLDADIKVDQFLIGADFPISRKQASERYGRPLPDGDAGEELLTAPAAPAIGGFGAPPSSGIPPRRIAAINEAAAVGRDAIFKAHAQAEQLAARRPVFKPIAEHLAAILAAPDAAAMRTAAENLRANSARLHASVMAQAPALAQPAERAIGTALVSGFAEAAKARALLATNEFDESQPRDEQGQWTAAGAAAHGEQSARRALATKRDVPDAMSHPALGSVDFRWGSAGDAAAGHEGGFGFAKIAAKHGEAQALRTPHIIAHGTLTQLGRTRAAIEHGGHRVVLSKDWLGQPVNHWVVASYEQKKGGR